MAAPNTDEQKSAVFQSFLSNLGLDEYYPNKLTLQSLLEINKNSLYEDAASSMKDIPWCFLRKLFKINAECRNCAQLPNHHEENNDSFDLDLYTMDDTALETEVNPLDLIAAVFYCADSFLQQEISLKMSMCQFSVPLLLPHGYKSECTLMLWALRDIIKDWRPQDLSETRGFVEKAIVQADIPLYSFVRLKKSGLSKSQFLNHILSRGQSNNNIFIHKDMKGGAQGRKISDGLVDIAWCLPCGRDNLDIFPQPVAFANLRGDIGQSLAQFKFLFHVSTATFVFLDKVEEDEQQILTALENVKSKLFLVVNHKGNDTKEDLMSAKRLLMELDLPKSNVKIKDPKVNVAGFSEKLTAAIKKSQTDSKTTIGVEKMQDSAVRFGLSVDECTSDDQKKAAEEVMNGIAESTTLYKKTQLPLQGINWKRLSQLAIEECRLRNAGDQSLEKYKCQLQEEKQQIMKELGKKPLSRAMKSFVEHLSNSDKKKRDFFLKWMKLKLNAHVPSEIQVASLRQELAKQRERKDVNLKEIAELGKILVDNSIGLEHYMRELALIYEVAVQSKQSADAMSHLPALGAEILLDGYPLELLDGDTSNIPERWVTDVLMELHKKVGQKSRMLVLTVLGVQSSGKSTLLNTMFGVQFPVSSGRCTRGAYMLFIKVGEDMQYNLNCDFIVLIDTEGLKSPQLALLEDSYEHDNQLATFVIGLSDITIINVAMENSTEMKDVLQIATHAFLRMTKIGKKPACHFVHQNVAGVSAHEKTRVERQNFLDQLNEMTRIAAEMEKQASTKAFTDVLDYDIEKNNWNIPGLWHGTPPMASVNTGYSEAVADFKKNLFETVKPDTGDKVSQVPQFLEWMRSLWKAVKQENFIFSFWNTLVAQAYDNLCKEFSQWEWVARKEILTWQKGAEVEIANTDNDSDLSDVRRLVESKKSQALTEIARHQNAMTAKLQEYYKRKDRNVHLIEKHKSEFLNSIKGLVNEIRHSVDNKLDYALDLRKSSRQVLDIQRKHRRRIEDQVMSLLSKCKSRSLSDEELETEFQNMWDQVTANVSGLKEQDIPGSILTQLKKTFLNRNIYEEMVNIGDLNKYVSQLMTSDGGPTGFLKKLFGKKDSKGELKAFANGVIRSCTQHIQSIAATNADYNEGFTKELLEQVDESLQKWGKEYNNSFEIDLKLHICSIASREFLQMHRKFLKERDPQIQLRKYKSQYLSDFLGLYKERDDCQRKASDFVSNCLKPGIEEYVSISLGIDIVDDILASTHSAQYSSRYYFQYNIQKELLEKEDFNSLLMYITNYEMYVKDWIFQQIQEKMAEDDTLGQLKMKNLQVVIQKITEAFERASKEEDGAPLPDNKESIRTLIRNVRQYLIKDISMSEEAEETTLFQIQCTCHPFTESLMKSLNELKEKLREEFSNSVDITETLEELPIKPQDQLFKRVFGCGHQCPFCKVPCEAGGKEHKHQSTVHRPQGLGGFSYDKSDKLVESLCTTDVHSERRFKNADTDKKWHPYKEYITYYPTWYIPPDPTIEASDYWKFVLFKYNDRFAEQYDTQPADIPDQWRSITKEKALKGLKDAFNIK